MKLHTCILLASTLLFGAMHNSPGQTAGNGNLVKTFSLVANRFQADAPRQRIYASVTASNSVAVIDTTTLTVTNTLAIGSAPTGMCLSPDGAKLYVALSGATKIGIIDLTTLTVLPGLTIAIKPWQVEAGLADRLYVTPASDVNGLIQVNATTGATEATLDTRPYYGGLLQISPDRKTLHFGNTGLSPSTLERFDVSTAIPVLDETSDFASTGSNGTDLKLSHNGQFLCYPNGSGNGVGYSTDVIDPANYAVREGTFAIGNYPSFLTFSPDDTIAYEYRFSNYMVYLFDTATFVQLATLDVPNDSVSDLITSGSGRYLFVADETAVEVYDLHADVTASLYSTTGVDLTYQAPIYILPTTITATGLPDGLTFDATTKTISGTPTEDGVFPIVITADDGTNTVTVNLTLTLYPDERAQNISTRLDVQTGDNVLIAGFIITGAFDEEVVVRGIGPSLEVNGQPLTGRLGNPMLELYDSAGTLLASNDDWQSDSQSYVLNNLNIAPTSFLEAALYRVLSPGAYTVTVRGVNNGTGIALAEVYDVGSNGQSGPGVSRLANISTRGDVQTGDNVMIGGVIIGGTDDAKMLIRAIGPSLADEGVTGVLGDPELDLYDAQGTKIASNDNWKDTQEAEIMATGLAPTDDLESAISISLAPAAYTAIVSGVGDTTGVGLVEAYNLP